MVAKGKIEPLTPRFQTPVPAKPASNSKSQTNRCLRRTTPLMSFESAGAVIAGKACCDCCGNIDVNTL